MKATVTRRESIRQLSVFTLGLAGLYRIRIADPGTPIVVYKDASCGCCSKWVEHLQASGFTASVTNSSDMSSIKARYHVPDPLKSCHTAIVGGYVVEGHVPAADIRRLLNEKPKVVGLTIPGMPASAPGMDAKPFVPYEVLSFDAKGSTATFAKHARA